MLLGPGYKDITIACVVKLFIHCAIKMEAVVKGLLAYPLPLGYLELLDPILLSRKSFRKLNGILEVRRKCEKIENVEVSVR